MTSKKHVKEVAQGSIASTLYTYYTTRHLSTLLLFPVNYGINDSAKAPSLHLSIKIGPY